MLLRDIPQPLRDIAFIRRLQGDGREECEILDCAFTWHRTPEGHHFWSLIEGGNFYDPHVIDILNKISEIHENTTFT